MNKLTYFLCVSLALTNISFFSIGLAEFTLFHGILLIFIMYSLVQVLRGVPLNTKIPVVLFALLFYISIFNLLFLNGIKVTSFVYSVIIVFELILLDRVSKKLELDDIRKIIKAIIFLYFVATSIEFLLIKFNSTPSGVWSIIFPTYDDGRQIRPMGLSSEPSYAAIILVFSLYLLFKCDNFLYNSNERFWYVLSVFTIIILGSSYGYMLLAVLFFYFIIKSNLHIVVLSTLVKRKQGIVVFFLLALVLILLLFNLESRSFQRLVTIYSILTTSGFDFVKATFNIANIDSSAGMRIVPTLQLINYFSDVNILYVLFGRGAGQATFFYSDLYGQLTLIGFIPAYIYNYGIIGSGFTLFLLLSLFPKKRLLLSILFFLFLFNADFNTQIFVYILFVAMLANKVEKLNALRE